METDMGKLLKKLTNTFQPVKQDAQPDPVTREEIQTLFAAELQTTSMDHTPR